MPPEAPPSPAGVSLVQIESHVEEGGIDEMIYPETTRVHQKELLVLCTEHPIPRNTRVIHFIIDCSRIISIIICLA